MAIPLLDSLDLTDKDITADALLTQRKLADYLVVKRQAHYHFTVKANQATLLDDVALIFQDRKQPHCVIHDPPDHGRIETRSIWTTPTLTAISTSPMSPRPSPSNGSPSKKRLANPLAISPTASPVDRPNKPMPNACSKSTAATGLSKTAATTSWTGTTTRIVAASAPAMALRT
jgi:hypothetical protein